MLNLNDPEIFREVLEHLPTAIYLVDADEKIRFWNDGAEQLTGYLRQDVVGHFCRENILSIKGPQGSRPVPSPDVDSATPASNGDSAPAAEASRNGPETPFQIAIKDGRVSEAEMVLHHRDGHRMPVRLRAIPIRDERGTVIGVAETFDASLGNTDWDRRQGKLSRYGALDEEIGVLSHNVVQSHLRESLCTFTEHRLPVSILLVEVSRLSELRMKFGPHIAPAALRATALSLESLLRATDYIGRWDEYRLLVVLPECSQFDLPAVVNKLEQHASPTELRWWGDDLALELTINRASAMNGDTVEELIARATPASRDTGKPASVVELQPR